MAVREKRTTAITDMKKWVNQLSQQFHLYCKYFLLNHNPWHGYVTNAWGGPIPDPDKDEDTLYLEDDNNSLFNFQYVDQFNYFQQRIEITALEIVHADVDRLRKICIECERP